jgi:serine/threonine-protein kinase SRPK3
MPFQDEHTKVDPVHVNQVLVDRYQVLQKLGSGRYSTVWLARDQK